MAWLTDKFVLARHRRRFQKMRKRGAPPKTNSVSYRLYHVELLKIHKTAWRLNDWTLWEQTGICIDYTLFDSHEY